MRTRVERAHMDTTLVLPRIDPTACSGCGDCVDVCRTGALTIQDRIAVFVNPEGCDYCTDCEAVCPVQAIACPFEIVVPG